MDYDDVSQIIRLHIYNKWAQYDQSLPLEPWVNRIITSQLINLSRNIYYSNARPCLKCPENEGGDLCRTYRKQCDLCPIFKRWQNGKKAAHDIRLPLPIENHSMEVYDMPTYDSADIERAIPAFHIAMKKVLRKREWEVYKLLYIDPKLNNKFK